MPRGRQARGIDIRAPTRTLTVINPPLASTGLSREEQCQRCPLARDEKRTGFLPFSKTQGHCQPQALTVYSGCGLGGEDFHLRLRKLRLAHKRFPLASTRGPATFLRVGEFPEEGSPLLLHPRLFYVPIERVFVHRHSRRTLGWSFVCNNQSPTRTSDNVIARRFGGKRLHFNSVMVR